MFILITCASCKAFKPYKVESYLVELAYQSGINASQEIKEAYSDLVEWDIVKEADYEKINDDLSFSYLKETINNLLCSDEYFDKWISNKKDNDLISEDEAKQIIKKAVNVINNPVIDNHYESKQKEHIVIDNYSLKDNTLITSDSYQIGSIIYLEDINAYKKIIDINKDGYILADPEFDELFEYLYISGSNEIDFNNCEIIPFNDETVETEYVNNKYELLASKLHSFNKDGFRVSYSFNSSGVNFRISKKNKEKLNMFFDVSLSNIKPTYKWDFKNGKLNEAFFKVNFKLTNELGFSTGKYDRYYLDFKDLDSSSFTSAVKSTIKTKDDEVECTIPICEIKTPIPNVPTAYFNIDVLAKVYVTGKVEIVLYNSGVFGFESKDGKFRVVHNVDKDSDFIIGGSARAVAGINFNLEAVDYRLMDIEFDGGVRAAVSTTLHLYDEEGNVKEEKSEVTYSILQEIAKENNDVRVCGDVSLNWVFDIQINTSKSILYKYGLTYKKVLLDSNDQVFNYLTHIENYEFVKKCTRKNRQVIKNTSTPSISSEKIVLSKYSQVVVKGESYEIPIVSIPSSYTYDDLVYYSNESSIASVKNGLVQAHELGATKIEIKTKDDKYKAYINILVSTG